MPHIFNYDQPELQEALKLLGSEKFRAKQIMQWLYHQDVTDFDHMINLPKQLRSQLSEHFSIQIPSVESENISPCGTIKWLFNFDADNAVETVFIPEKNRGTLCISSQIGCALACQFCATGLVGFYRNLTTAEIIAQVWFARAELTKRFPNAPRISNIVFMGMGEPLLNEQNVFRSVRILLDDLGFGLSKHRVTISTSGIVPAMKRLVNSSDAALAVSLHAPNNTIRDRIVPINKQYNLDQLMAICDEYITKKNRTISYEYVMLDGINDQDQHAHELSKLLRDKKVKVNLIPYNPVTGLDLKCTSEQQINRFQRILLAKNIRTTVRKTRGDSINAACGQLYGQVISRKKTIQANHYMREEAH